MKEYLLKYPSMAQPRLVKIVEDFYSDRTLQSTDEMLDRAIQILIVIDCLDGLQDIQMDESGFYLCFDPIFEKDEIGTILHNLKNSYSQARLVDTPNGNCSTWWVIEIKKISKEISDLENMGTSKNEENIAQLEKTFTNPQHYDRIDSLTKNIDINKALNLN